MKKIFLAFTATTILAVALFNNANAQQSSASVSGIEQKLTLSFAATGDTHDEVYNGANASSLNMRALKDFQKSFKDAANVSWYKAENGALLASFTIDEVKNSVAYDKKGRWLYSIKRYSEQKLPKDLRAGVKSVYYDFNIVNIEEVEINDQTIYIIHLEDATSMKTLRICDGDMEEVQNFVKG